MFVRGGYVYPRYNLDVAGNLGNYWSSVGRNSSGAYSLGFYSGNVGTSNDLSRYFGQSLRCVALGG